MLNKEGYSAEESEWAQQQIRPYAEICGTSDKDLDDLSKIYIETIERRRRSLASDIDSSQQEIVPHKSIWVSIAEYPEPMDLKRMSGMSKIRKVTALIPIGGVIVGETVSAVTGQNFRDYYPLLATPWAGTAMSHFLLWIDRNSEREIRVPA